MKEHNPTFRVITILQYISDKPEGYTLSELTKLTGIPVGTISPILKTLLHHKFLEIHPETNRYKIGIYSFYIGASFVSRNTTLELIRKEMQRLSETCNETSQFGILKGGQIFYLIKVESQETIRVVSEVGGSLPAYATALGKALLSGCTEEQISEMYADGLKPITENTITSMDELLGQIEMIKQTGVASEEGESGLHTSCLGVPIMQDNKVVAGLSVVFPSFRNTPEKAQEALAMLQHHKSNIEKILMNYRLETA